MKKIHREDIIFHTLKNVIIILYDDEFLWMHFY
jgi:hypothetical protein